MNCKLHEARDDERSQYPCTPRLSPSSRTESILEPGTQRAVSKQINNKGASIYLCPEAVAGAWKEPPKPPAPALAVGQGSPRRPCPCPRPRPRPCVANPSHPLRAAPLPMTPLAGGTSGRRSLTIRAGAGSPAPERAAPWPPVCRG